MTLDGSVDATPFLIDRKDHDQPSVFLAANMLREARRQRGLVDGKVPDVCLLDPDGDVVRYLIDMGRANRSPSWACYHTELWETSVNSLQVGIVPHAVGAPFAVLVAEELFASGCRLLISVTSAGAIDATNALPDVMLIDRALRGEGTSHAYLPTSIAVDGEISLMTAVAISWHPVCRHAGLCGTSWTTDAPFRETTAALEEASRAGALVVEMEAAALYAYGRACQKPIVCFAHITNSMAVDHGDFEKGPSNGAERALSLVEAASTGWRCLQSKQNADDPGR